MSIYRGWKDRTLDRHDEVPGEGPQDSQRVSPPAAPPVHLRRAQPAAVLLPRTSLWIASLPEPARPAHLVAHFARIANAIAASWHRPNECRAYFDELLTDRRGDRRGFPREILSELLALRNLHASIYPAPECTWADIERDWEKR